ncbi:hypothetical protein [Kaistia adipata]|uniref:hypothetical protein n=1 Tax=Kaistia adipata TaxID=166954 RepID=UPI00041545DA|nr:hypothetical protein [Kaistia adipata]
MKKFATITVAGRLLELDAPGLKSRTRKNGSVYVYWEAPPWAPDFRPRTVGFQPDWNEPSDFERIAAECRALQRRAEEMAGRVALSADPPAREGTLGQLLNDYRSAADSPMRALRGGTRDTYERWIGLLAPFRDVGLREVDLEGLRAWFAAIGAPSGPGAAPRGRRATAAFQMLRMVLAFGAARGRPFCADLERLARRSEFDPSGARRDAMKPAQANRFVRHALSAGEIRLALSQACQFELGLSQAEVIGDWLEVEAGYVPQAGEILFQRRRWTGGLTFEMLNGHVLTVPSPGGDLVFDLSKHQLVLACLERIPDRAGPFIVRKDGRPYDRFTFARAWRALADEAGLPADLWNSDSSRLRG